MREGAPWAQHSSERKRGGGLGWEMDPTVHGPCDVVDEPLFRFGPQCLCVSGSRGRGLGLEGLQDPLLLSSAAGEGVA